MTNQKDLDKQKNLEADAMEFVKEQHNKVRRQSIEQTQEDPSPEVTIAMNMTSLMASELVNTFYPSDINMRVAGLIGSTTYFVSATVDYDYISERFNKEISTLLQEVYDYNTKWSAKSKFLVNAFRFAFKVGNSFSSGVDAYYEARGGSYA